MLQAEVQSNWHKLSLPKILFASCQCEANVKFIINCQLSGIDVKDVSLVINYDMAKSIEMYTHR